MGKNRILESKQAEYNLHNIPAQIVDRVIRSYIDTELLLLEDIMKQLIGRDPNKEDYQELHRAYSYTNPMNYDLFFKGVQIGSVEFQYAYPPEQPVPENHLYMRFIPKSFR